MQALVSLATNASFGFSYTNFAKLRVYCIEEYRSVIDERALKGWRYVGYIPVKQRGSGHIQEMDLIFEKEE